MVDVSIIIVNWNTKDLLRNCLKSVIQETRQHSYEIIVVDNFSPDRSADMVAEEFPEVILIANADNKGFAAANNQGLEIAKGNYLMLLNPDTVVLDQAIDRMLAYANAPGNEVLGVLTCKLLNADRSLQKSVNRFYSFSHSLIENRLFADWFKNLDPTGKYFVSYWDHSISRPIDWAFGAVMLFSRKVMEKVGVLDEQFYIYAEEIDYFLRVHKAGFQSYFLADVHIVHYGSSSARQKRALMFIQNYRSFFLFLRKHYGFVSYALYRFRSIMTMFFWLTYFNLRKDEEALVQREVYAKTLKWNLGL